MCCGYGSDWDVYGQDAAATQTMGVTHCGYDRTNQRARFLSATLSAPSQCSREYCAPLNSATLLRSYISSIDADTTPLVVVVVLAICLIFRAYEELL